MPSEPELLLTTSRFRVVREYQPLANGQTRPREIVRHPGAVVIVPLLDSGEVCLIRNYRISVKQTLLELPAGTLEPNEPPIETAGRELIEETGFRAAKIFPLHQFFLSPGILDERMHAFLATGLTAGPTALEAGEEIINEVVPLEVAVGKIFSGEIQDAKTIAALLMVDHLRRHGQLPR
ncbi:MAG: NUDIX hydrolase [Pirellulales bacterium]